jgi:hypothetical protein
VNWRQNPELSILLHKGKLDDCRKSWNIRAYLQEISETFGQSTGSSTAVTPSLEFYVAVIIDGVRAMNKMRNK